MEDIKKTLQDIATSSSSDQEKLAQLTEAIANLKPVDNAEALTLGCTYGISFAQRTGRHEMEAQFYMTRAKVTIMGKSIFAVREMKDIKMAPRWFNLHSKRKRKNTMNWMLSTKKFWRQFSQTSTKDSKLSIKTGFQERLLSA